jgi:pimeloyl-ACP methyl ester carboxylesterase
MPQAAGMYYFANGEDDWSRPAVILLHGAGGNHLHWPSELRRLEGQRIYAPDLPGHGKSDGIGRQSIADYAGCVLAFMDDLKVRKAIFVGHSMGGAIALHMALNHGRRTLGIGLINTAPTLRLPVGLLENTLTPATLSLAVKKIGELAFSPQADPRLKENAIQRMSEIRSSVLHGDFLACNAFDVFARLGRIKVPTLILSGADDKMVPPHYAQTMHQKIKNSLLLSMDGAGHMLMLENPVMVTRSLGLFLSGVDYQPGSRD